MMGRRRGNAVPSPPLAQRGHIHIQVLHSLHKGLRMQDDKVDEFGFELLECGQSGRWHSGFAFPWFVLLRNGATQPTPRATGKKFLNPSPSRPFPTPQLSTLNPQPVRNPQPLLPPTPSLGFHNSSPGIARDRDFCFRCGELPAPVSFRIAIAKDGFVAHPKLPRLDRGAIEPGEFRVRYESILGNGYAKADWGGQLTTAETKIVVAGDARAAVVEPK